MLLHLVLLELAAFSCDSVAAGDFFISGFQNVVLSANPRPMIAGQAELRHLRLSAGLIQIGDFRSPREEQGACLALKVMASDLKPAMMGLPGSVNVVPALNEERTLLISTETNETVCEQFETATSTDYHGL